jgi:PAS domain-containing protein
MARVRPSQLSAPTGELPDELYIGFVDGLLDDIVPVVLLSAIAVTCGEIVAGVAAKNVVLLHGSSAQLIIAAVRLFYLDRHAREIPSATVDIARRQERNFSLGALASLAALSLWTLLAFYVTNDSFARFVGVSMTTAYAFSLMSRSYAVYRGVNLQLIAAFAPLSAAMIVAGGWYPAGIVTGILPLVLYMKGYSKRLRANFMAVVAAQQEAATLAARLDTALNNMSHGLCMVDGQGRIIVANDQAFKVFGLRPGDAPVGAHARSVFRALVRKGVIARTQFLAHVPTRPPRQRRLRRAVGDA